MWVVRGCGESGRGRGSLSGMKKRADRGGWQVCVAARPARGPLAARSAATDEIVDSLKNLTLLEASELVKQIETWKILA